MATETRISSAAAVCAAALLAALHAATMSAPAPPAHAPELDGDEIELIGNAGRPVDSEKPKLTASFSDESYRPGGTARLVISDTAPNVSVQIFRAGGEAIQTFAHDVMRGTPVGRPSRIGSVHGRRVVSVALGDWPSGVYFARLTAPGSRVGFAPFVLAPTRLGEHRIAVVMPTQTWQAYNWRDDDGDGSADSWYACACKHTARLGRPFLNRGTPPHYKYYEIPFLRWIAQSGHDADIISDAELKSSSGRQLAKAYSLLIFSGHHEYVTTHEYDAVTDFRNRGGNLMFLSANNFFWKIVIRHHVMTRVVKWRDIGRPESALIGVEYFHNDGGQHRGNWIVRSAQSLPWLFEGTGVGNGSKLSNGGVEGDRMTSASPRSTKLVADIPNLYGPGMTAQMTYYEKAGAKVFAAGAFTLAGGVRQPKVEHLIENLWKR